MNPDNVKLLASIAGIIIGFFGVVTVPITMAIKSLRNEIKAEMAALRAEMREMETRLNQRIDTHLVHR